MGKYKRTLQELRARAVLNWPQELIEIAGEASILPLLLKTQDKFISVLTLADTSPDSWENFVDISKNMPGNMFLKHLMILSDLGGEALNKYTPVNRYFKNNRMEYIWNETLHHYDFKVIHQNKPLTNSSLKVDGKSLAKGYSLNDKMKDVIMLILHGSSCINGLLPDSEKFVIGNLLGESEKIQHFVKQNYIRVSRQVSGATAVKLGSLAEKFVMDILKQELPEFDIQQGGKIEKTTFDIVVISPAEQVFGIEVSFQFTTNGTIERKAREAKSLAAQLHSKDYYICHVIDGEGNINIRENAVSTICQYSDCTVAFSEDEIKILADFIREKSES